MSKLKRVELSMEAGRRNLEQLARLGGELQAARRRRRLTQRQIGALVGLSQPTVSALERGHGGGHTMDTWQRLALATGRPLRVELQRDRAGETDDAGHLAIQELVLRLSHPAGWSGNFELAPGGSSVAWVRALTQGTEPPAEPGLVWCDVATTRLSAWRRR